MKLQYFSDTHYNPYSINPDADLVINGGDSSNGLKEILFFVDQCRELNKEHLVVLGNHDFWTHNIEDVYFKLDQMKVNYLNEHKVFKFNDYTFVGGTMFSNFRANHEEEYEVEKTKNSLQFLADFHRIYSKDMKVLPNDYHTYFNRHLNNINKYRNQENVILVTHFPLTPLASDPLFSKTDSLSKYFTNDISLEGFKLHLYAHTHYNADFIVDGCRCIGNAIGYPSELYGRDFIPDLLIEV